MQDDKSLVISNPIKMSNVENTYYHQHARKIMFVGSLEERKGVIDFAKSLHTNSRFFKNYELKFIGQDTKRNQDQVSTQSLITKLTKNDQLNIIFYGHLKHEEVLEKIRNEADIIVAPLLYDNLPYVILESMNLGKPIIALWRHT